jgi:glucose/arabinose dehydrogenase
MGNAQNVNTLLGKVLRIDVATSPYSIPTGNMTGGKPELWDIGLRNPWRFTFDACTGDMYLADEGQSAFEEVNVEPAGAGRKNYGWATMEGNQCVQAGCNQAGLTLPTYSYPAGQGGNNAVIGGYVYRGAANPALRGRYIYGDYVSGRIWAVASGGMPQEIATVAPNTLVSFGQDSSFELYTVLMSGTVNRLDP